MNTHRVNGVELAVIDWPGSDPAVLLCHATGFHARCWDQIVNRLQGVHCVALDFRWHGRSAQPAPPYSWRRFGEDLAELTRQLGLRNAVGVGHSMGGHAVTLAAALNPDAFSALLLLDPVMLPQDAYGQPGAPLDFVARRRNEWASPVEMYERFKDRPPFQSWDRAVLRDYCDHALSGSALACPPEIEAAIYGNSTALDANIYPEIASIDMPVRIVRSASPYTYGRFDGSPTADDLASHFKHATDERLTGVSHFIPMEAPDLTARHILNVYNASRIS